VIEKLYNRFFSNDKELVSFLKAITGIAPKRLRLYKQVFSHRSKFSEPDKNNERRMGSISIVNRSCFLVVFARYRIETAFLAALSFWQI
jgi:hypothetical protein